MQQIFENLIFFEKLHFICQNSVLHGLKEETQGFQMKHNTILEKNSERNRQNKKPCVACRKSKD